MTTTAQTGVTTQVYRVYIHATPEAIWDAITNPEWTERYGYGGRAEYDLRAGGAYRATTSEAMRAMGAPDVAVDGEVVEADPPNRLVQTWRMVMDEDMLSEQFGTADEAPAVVVYERRSGITPADLAAATADKAAFSSIDGVVADKVVGPIPATDNQALQLLVPIRMGTGGWDTLTTVVGDMQTKATPRDAGLSMHVAGPAGVAAAFGEAFEGVDGTLLYSAVTVVIIILLLTYRSPILWLFPVIAAGVALGSAQGSSTCWSSMPA